MKGFKLALAFGTCVSATVAFLPPSPVSSISLSRSQFRAFDCKLSAKRRRRRTNDETSEIAQPVGDDLPEFDLEPEFSGDGSPNNLEYLSSDDPFKVSEAMMGKESPVRSVKELITDRALEKSFKFDEPLSGESLPDLTAFEVASGTGKKKARKEARREAAIKAKADENSDLLKDVPAMFQGEDGKFSPVKVRCGNHLLNNLLSCSSMLAYETGY